MKQEGLYIALISIHGLIRAENLELGKDADTGGQTRYVVELAKALSEHPKVARVDLITRQIRDSKLDPIYSQEYEQLTEKAAIIRIPCGPRRYLRKESLWPYLDYFTDGVLLHFKRIKMIPTLIHAHYADAGYVGASLSSLLEIPLVFTGHSLGREKKRRLLDNGADINEIREKYNIEMRIEAEEFTLSVASFVVASTFQEIEEQYRIYENYQKSKMTVLPPGYDEQKFFSTSNINDKNSAKIYDEFLKDPSKPIILAISRADERKNIQRLLEAYGESTELQAAANLVLILGNRDDITAMDSGQRKVLTQVLLHIDKFELYGKVAYPKKHSSEDIPSFYRNAKNIKGVFINAALTEPFGLTLIEASACGVPIVSTNDGGPKDIIKNLQNGILVDPQDKVQIQEALLQLLRDKNLWSKFSRNGTIKTPKTYTWKSHVNNYIKNIEKYIKPALHPNVEFLKPTQKLSLMNRLLICDIDNTLLGDNTSLRQLIDVLDSNKDKLVFGVATGRNLQSAKKVLEEWGVPTPDLFITSVGAEIHYGKTWKQEHSWNKHISHAWDNAKIKSLLSNIPGIKLQSKLEQREHKISYLIDTKKAPRITEIRKYLRRSGVKANVIFSHGEFLDILPIRASKGHAIRFMALKWGVPFGNILVAGDSGNDEEMLKDSTLGVVVGNYSNELNKLRGNINIYFAHKDYAMGILEGIHYYDFFGDGEVNYVRD